MGASGWVSRVDYRPDLAAALDEARWDAFRGGHYYQGNDLTYARDLTEDEFVEDWIEEWGPDAEQAGRAAWQAVQQDPDGPDSLLASQPYSGTHSVIDMTGVAETPDYGKVAPAPHDLLERTFSTQTPSTDEVASKVPDLWSETYDRDCGMYIVAYRDQTPETIFFLGFSGD